MWAHLWYGSDIFRIEFEQATTDKKKRNVLLLL